MNYKDLILGIFRILFKRSLAKALSLTLLSAGIVLLNTPFWIEVLNWVLRHQAVAPDLSEHLSTETWQPWTLIGLSIFIFVIDVWSKREKPKTEIINLTSSGDQLFHSFLNSTKTISTHIRAREFQSLVKERAKEIVGRDFIFDEIESCVKSEDFPSGYIIISAEPGIGKTTIMSKLVNDYGYVHHFNIASQNIVTVADFLTNICAQLIIRHELDYSSLPSSASKDSGFLSQLLSEISEKSLGEPNVILVDALDEASTIGLGLGGNKLLLPRTLPKGIFFVLTTREQHDERLVVDRRHDIHLQHSDERNLSDIDTYIQRYLKRDHGALAKRIDTWDIDETTFRKALIKKSEGNFMYLIYVLPELKNGQFQLDELSQIENLPNGLSGYYQSHWRKMRDEKTGFQESHEPIVCVLATAKEPISISTILRFTKDKWPALEQKKVIETLHAWREFLNEEKKGAEKIPLYSIYHKSFSDFLREEVGLKEYHKQIANQALSRIPGFLNE